MRRAFGILGGIFGLVVLYWVSSGGQSLHRLLDEEGGESFSAAHGFGGVLGCIAFLILVAMAAFGLICYRAFSFRRVTQRA